MDLAPEVVEPLAETFHLLGEPNRLRLVLGCREGSQNVHNLAEHAGISASLASHHLRLLRASRILRAERHGREVRYALADAHVRALIENMVVHLSEAEAEEPPARISRR